MNDRYGWDIILQARNKLVKAEQALAFRRSAIFHRKEKEIARIFLSRRSKHLFGNAELQKNLRFHFLHFFF
jgi:hypothetical protein